MIAAMSPARLPDRAHPRGAQPLELLFEQPRADADARAMRDGPLADRYRGSLSIPLRADRPTVVANFVETLDGIAAMDVEGRTGGGEVSGFSPTDRFVMGLLRALADVVLVGAGTVRSSDRGEWTPGAVSPADAPAYADLRRHLGLAPEPTTVIATAHGRLDASFRVFSDAGAPVVVAAPPAAIETLRRRLPGRVRFEPTADDSRGRGAAILAALHERGHRLVLSEGGPHLIADLVADSVLDELFLTLSPQLAGRGPGAERFGLVEGVALWPHAARWLRLLSVRRAGDHLLIRYGFEEDRS